MPGIKKTYQVTIIICIQNNTQSRGIYPPAHTIQAPNVKPPRTSNPYDVKLSQMGYTRPYFQHR